MARSPQLVALLFLAPALAHAALTSQPPAVQFPDTGVLAQSAAQQLAFTNNGNQVNVQAITVAGANPMDFVLSGLPQLPLSLGNGAGFSMSVVFAPTAGGARQGTLTVMLNGQPAVTVPLSGNAIGAKATLMPAMISLGGLPFGQVVPPATVTVQNAGGGKVSAKSLTLAGPDAAAFSLQGVPNLPVGLGPNQSFTFQLVFTPKVKNQAAHATLSLASDDPQNPTLSAAIVGIAGDPAITLDAGTIIFGNQRIGIASAPQVVQIGNAGFSTLHVTDLALGGANAGDFTLMKPMLPAVIAVGQSASLQVAFDPQAMGARTGQITVKSDDPVTPAKLLPLTGAGTTAMASVSPNQLDFGTIKVNQPSTKNLTISNAGGGVLTVTQAMVTGAQAAWFSVPALPMGGLAVPGAQNGVNGTAALAVTFKPQDNGMAAAVLNLATDDAKLPKIAIPLAGVGSSPTISVTPAMHDFGPVSLGQTAMAQTITVQNGGSLPLTILQVQSQGKNPNDFPIQNQPQPGTQILPGKTLAFDVTFAPTKHAAEAMVLYLFSDDPNTASSHLNFYGQGVQAGIGVSPMAIDFGMAIVGSDPIVKMVTVDNPGDAPLPLTQVQIVGTGASMGMQLPFASDLKGAPPTVDPGKSLTFGVVFTPAMAGSWEGRLDITPMDQALGVSSVDLTASAMSPAVAVQPVSLDFGQVAVGESSAPQSLTVQNLGGKPLKLDRLTSSEPQFGPAGTLGQSIAPGATLMLPITFSPTAAAPASGALELYVIGSKLAAATVKVSGIGIQPKQKSGCSLAAARRVGGAPWALAWALLAAVGRRRARRAGGSFRGSP